MVIRVIGTQVLICGHIMPALTVKLDARAFFRDNWEPQYTSRSERNYLLLHCIVITRDHLLKNLQKVMQLLLLFRLAGTGTSFQRIQM